MAFRLWIYILSGLGLLVLTACNNSTGEDAILPERTLTREFKEYWFAGEAEITSYNLQQFRYGELRDGEAVLIFVTEDFLEDKQVKANDKGRNTQPVLKLNFTKNFLTGIYPYSIMQSTFYPLEGTSHAFKVTASVQEWCGQVYMQLNNRNGYELRSFSYFEEEADQSLSLARVHLENEVWTQLRIDPTLLPTGDIEIIPSFEFLRLHHREARSYMATAEFYQDENLSVYKIFYPGLQRTLQIYFNQAFPFSIEQWTESITKYGQTEVTKATKNSDLKIDYWTKNSNKDLPLREQLNLK